LSHCLILVVETAILKAHCRRGGGSAGRPKGGGFGLRSTGRTVLGGVAAVAAVAAGTGFQRQPSPTTAPITIDYPAEGSIFPPEITPPTFLWRDASPDAAFWRIVVQFNDDSPPVRVLPQCARMKIGAIDPRCIAETNELPKLTAREAAAWTWTPDAATWAEIKGRSAARPAEITITGFRDGTSVQALSSGNVTIRTSKDPVGAPIFYRDVPLMPSEPEKGVIKPLAPNAIPLVAWRLRHVGEPRSRLLLEGMPTCANCHSFSSDGRTLGMDLDGPQNDKGMYAIASVAPRTTVRSEDVISWNSLQDRPASPMRVGLMSQVSPDGQFVVTTVNPEKKDLRGSYYVANFMDYHFLQVFYPTRGILVWYSRATGKIQPLPGADDPRHVQTGAVWSPDGKYLVFSRAEARDPYPDGRRAAEHANDPNETPIQYDLYRIPFNGGMGGRPEPIAGASRNGMSNSFPKVSPDGRWIVFVQCRNGQLMRPDSELYIVPAEGGQARKMECNTPLMNSWHSFSPNGRWMAFSSKGRSPYTQMFLTHIDEDGNDSPAILIENATAANRAVNIPEFLHISAGGLVKIDVPAIESYRQFERAMALAETGLNEPAAAAWQELLKTSPEDAKVLNNLGAVLLRLGRHGEAIPHLQKAAQLNPESAGTRNNLGTALLRSGSPEEAAVHFRMALKIDPEFADAHFNLASYFHQRGKFFEAVEHWREGLRLDPNRLSVLTQTAWVLATCPKGSVRNGTEAVDLAQRAVRLSDGHDPEVLDTLAAAYAESGRFSQAVQAARRALALASQQNRQALVEILKARVELYEAGKRVREDIVRPQGGT
jgi:Flp pilus assembly protein TadD